MRRQKRKREQRSERKGEIVKEEGIERGEESIQP